MGTAGDRRGFLSTLLADGRPLLLAMAGGLVFAGGFALFLAATGEFLPHDIHYLGLSAADLCRIADCRIVDFMVHDRAAFGGTLIGIGVLYVWLVVFPLSDGEAWAWLTLLVSGCVGFSGFLAYLTYGYLDSWHGIGTLLLLPLFVFGMAKTRRLVTGPLSIGSFVRRPAWVQARGRIALGRAVLLVGALATAAGGLAILRVGVGDTFVPEDLEFMRLSAEQIRAVSPRLVPLLAHDRVGFGTGVFTLGLTTAMCLWQARLSRHLHQAVAVSGVGALLGALGTHFAVGYTDTFHLAPAVLAAGSLLLGLALQHPGDAS